MHAKFLTSLADKGWKQTWSLWTGSSHSFWVLMFKSISTKRTFEPIACVASQPMATMWTLLSLEKESRYEIMQQSTQALGVVDRLFLQILSGEKTSTIRWQERHIVLGTLKFICDVNSSQTVDVEVFRCTDMPLSEAASFVGRADDWPGEIMLEGMREHYPDIQLSSIVQVIEYKLPELK